MFCEWVGGCILLVCKIFPRMAMNLMAPSRKGWVYFSVYFTSICFSICIVMFNSATPTQHTQVHIHYNWEGSSDVAEYHNG